MNWSSAEQLANAPQMFYSAAVGTLHGDRLRADHATLGSSAGSRHWSSPR